MGNGIQSPLSLKERLLNELKDPLYRRAFVEGHARDTIAFQLRMLRKAREWEQGDVAERLGNRKLQPMVSRYENPDYGRYSVRTLLELAEVFDVALVVRFEPFSELVRWDWASSATTLCPPRFEKDIRLSQMGAEIRTAETEQTGNVQRLGLSLVLGSIAESNPSHSKQSNTELAGLIKTDGGAYREGRVA
ncbi:MAG: helix-turn-helix domain-containing protein [Terriglobia bacterium]